MYASGSEESKGNTKEKVARTKSCCQNELMKHTGRMNASGFKGCCDISKSRKRSG